jgi:hypothetical protein
MKNVVHLGYEIGTGIPVNIPIEHMAVTGRTQASGKTTTLEALVTRSGRQAVAFITKRHESGFHRAHIIPPYFRERADWRFVQSVLEATMREKMRFERSWIMRATKGASTLAEIQENVLELGAKAKRSMDQDMFMVLGEYLKVVVPQIDRLPYIKTVKLNPGLNVMDLTAYSTELQGLVIRSVLEWVYEHGNGVLVIIPEAWEFIPYNRGSPVLLACEQLIRKGGAGKNFVWLDSQDIASVHNNVLRSAGVWLMGVQREAHEVKRAIVHMGASPKPKPEDVMRLERGQFFACFGRSVTPVYVQPAWMKDEDANAIARGEVPVEHAVVYEALSRQQIEVAEQRQDKAIEQEPEEPEEADVKESEAQALRTENKQLTERNRHLQATVDDLSRRLRRIESAHSESSVGTAPRPDPETGVTPIDEQVMAYIYDEVKRRAAADPGILEVLTSRPEIRVTVTRRTIQASEDTLQGRLAMLIYSGFFNDGATASAAHTELQRLGRGSAKPSVYKECDKLATLGFLTKETNGYRAVEGMKVNVEA